MFKKLSLCMVLIIIVGLFVGCYEDYTYNENDFLLEISVDKTVASVGETVTVTAKLTNLSGRDIRVKLPHPWNTEIKNILGAGFFIKDGYPYGFGVNPVGGRRKTVTIKKDAIIQRTFEFIVAENETYLVAAAAFLIFDDNLRDLHIIETEPIEIIIRE